MKGNESIFPDPMRGADVSADNQNPHDLPKGLTKREYFAAKSLQGLLAYSEYTPVLSDEDMIEDSENGKWCKYYGYWVSQEGGNTHTLVTTFEQRMARVAVKYADALLAELEK